MNKQNFFLVLSNHKKNVMTVMTKTTNKGYPCGTYRCAVVLVSDKQIFSLKGVVLARVLECVTMSKNKIYLQEFRSTHKFNYKEDAKEEIKTTERMLKAEKKFNRWLNEFKEINK